MSDAHVNLNGNGGFTHGSYADDGIETTFELTQADSEIAATYDALLITERLGRHNPPARIDVHTFAYLACLMSVFSGQPAFEWGYSFSAVPPTLPFSPLLDRAIEQLSESNYVTSASQIDSADLAEFTLTDAGRVELDFLSSLHLLSPRIQFLESATSSAVFTSSAAVVNSLANESQLATAMKLNSSRQLLSETSIARLYREFDALSKAIGRDDVNLIVPASMYVTYLQSLSKSVIDETYGEGIR